MGVALWPRLAGIRAIVLGAWRGHTGDHRLADSEGLLEMVRRLQLLRKLLGQVMHGRLQVVEVREVLRRVRHLVLARLLSPTR